MKNEGEELRKALEDFRVAFWDAVSPPLLRLSGWIERFAEWLQRKP